MLQDLMGFFVRRCPTWDYLTYKKWRRSIDDLHPDSAIKFQRLARDFFDLPSPRSSRWSQCDSHGAGDQFPATHHCWRTLCGESTGPHR